MNSLTLTWNLFTVSISQKCSGLFSLFLIFEGQHQGIIRKIRIWLIFWRSRDTLVEFCMMMTILIVVAVVVAVVFVMEWVWTEEGLRRCCIIYGGIKFFEKVQRSLTNSWLEFPAPRLLEDFSRESSLSPLWVTSGSSPTFRIALSRLLLSESTDILIVIILMIC